MLFCTVGSTCRANAQSRSSRAVVDTNAILVVAKCITERICDPLLSFSFVFQLSLTVN
jgi:hypothetical protein